MNSPFDANRYARLLEGLEVCIVTSSQVLDGTSTRRIDPEYFQKQHLADAAHIAARPAAFHTLSDLKVRIDGSAFYPAIEQFYGEGELPFLRVADVDAVIDFENCTRIPAELCDRFSTLSRVHPGDIVFTKGGSVARVGLVNREAAASRDLIFLNSSTLPVLDQMFLYLYFQTGLFNRMLVRSSSQTAQPHLTITLVRHLAVLRASDRFKERCVVAVNRAYVARAEAINNLHEAERLLTAALGLADWQPPEPLTYTRCASEAFTASRFDAEFFHPAKQSYLDGLRALPGESLGAYYASVREMFDPTAAGADDLVRNFDLTDALQPVLDDRRDPMRAREVGSTKKRFKAGDVVTSRLRAYLRETALVRTSSDVPSVGSSEFIVLRPKQAEPPGVSGFLCDWGHTLLLKESVWPSKRRCWTSC